MRGTVSGVIVHEGFGPHLVNEVSICLCCEKFILGVETWGVCYELGEKDQIEIIDNLRNSAL